jgi:hypothetical protein
MSAMQVSLLDREIPPAGDLARRQESRVVGQLLMGWPRACRRW